MSIPQVMIFFCIITLASADVWADTAEEVTSKYRDCKVKQDCVLFEDPCEPWIWYPINKTKENIAGDKLIGGGINCMSLILTKPQVDCISHKCSLVPDKTGCILYYESQSKHTHLTCAALCKADPITGICTLSPIVR